MSDLIVESQAGERLDRKLSPKEAEVTSFKLAKELRDALFMQPEFTGAVIEDARMKSAGLKADRDKVIRFRMGDYRYAIEMISDAQNDQSIDMRRRSVASAEESSVAGTRSEDKIPNYWEEIVQIGAEGPGSRFHAPTIGYWSPKLNNGKDQMVVNNRKAVDAVEGVAKELQDRASELNSGAISANQLISLSSPS